MGYCGPRGIRYSEFLDWDQLDQDAALAWQARELARCRCGQVPAEWREYDEMGHPVLDEHGAHAEAKVKPFFVAEEFCPACRDLARANDSSPHADNPGRRLKWEPNPAYREPPEPIGAPPVAPDVAPEA